MTTPNLVYLACPTRLGRIPDMQMAMIKYAAANGKAPLHPHAAMPEGIYENGHLNRDVTMQLCYRLVDLCDEFWICGISEGVLMELRHFFSSGQHQVKPLVLVAGRFDPEWQEQARKLKPAYADVLLRVKEIETALS
jgi:hypothetical protein